MIGFSGSKNTDDGRAAQKPVFVRGISRSGTTLLVTMLDAHPDIAMSYELFPSLLAPVREHPSVDLPWLIEVFSNADSLEDALNTAGAKSSNLKTFLARCRRSELDQQGIISVLKEHVSEGLDFSTESSRMKFVERCCIPKMSALGKKRWGAKCNNNYDAYLSAWPDAYFINIIRDGRDVLASQLNTGTFSKKFSDLVERVGRSWVNTHTRFYELLDKGNVHAYPLFYERLVSNPEVEVRKLCGFLGIPFSDSLLTYYDQDLTIYKPEAGRHISLPRISKPLDTRKIGRWRSELSDEQLEQFYRIARETLVKLGYMQVSDDVTSSRESKLTLVQQLSGPI